MTSLNGASRARSATRRPPRPPGHGVEAGPAPDRHEEEHLPGGCPETADQAGGRREVRDGVGGHSRVHLDGGPRGVGVPRRPPAGLEGPGLTATLVVYALGRPVDTYPCPIDTRVGEPLDGPAVESRGQRSLAVRAVYFVLVGWWLSLLWANVASFVALTVVGLPVAIWVLNRLPYVTSLYRFHG